MFKQIVSVVLDYFKIPLLWWGGPGRFFVLFVSSLFVVSVFVASFDADGIDPVGAAASSVVRLHHFKIRQSVAGVVVGLGLAFVSINFHKRLPC